MSFHSNFDPNHARSTHGSSGRAWAMILWTQVIWRRFITICALEIDHAWCLRN